MCRWLKFLFQPEESSSGCPILPVQESFGPVSSSPEDCEIKDSNSCQASAGYGCEIKDDNQSSSVDHNYSYLSQLKSETGENSTKPFFFRFSECLHCKLLFSSFIYFFLNLVSWISYLCGNVKKKKKKTYLDIY